MPSVNGIVWQRQLANEALPHQRLCSLWVSSSSLTTNRNLRWYLGFPKQEAAKSSKRAIHFPLIMMLPLNPLWGYWSVFQRVARDVFHPHFSPDERPTLPGEEPGEGCLFLCAELGASLWLRLCSFLQAASHPWLPYPCHSAAQPSSNPFCFQDLFCGGGVNGSFHSLVILMHYKCLLQFIRVAHIRHRLVQLQGTEMYLGLQVPLDKWSRSGLGVVLCQGDELSQPKLLSVFFFFSVLPSSPLGYLQSPF